ncbi:Hypothetical protein PFR_JS13-2_2151 [Propionibacterium freudenreichii]|nr:Hypothetical protein PFR_JS11_2162 [Propionibacterium freudenreichii]SBT30302.1 Hypothetical protein PFR_JS14_2143 [Propionibacterium freudenreichii]SCQ50180.1 Hypothetical protein PFR_JS13-1_2164 [Propionibacterium freudenreichii]SCQ55883.1 Hypothetical protein PFR_JS13-2_2151 [Propionibacterium freudenreichii]
MSSGLWKALRKGPDSPGFGEALVKMLNRSGVTFIKLGQVLSTRPDVLPGAVMTALTSLWDTAAPAPEQNIRTMLRSQWGRDPEEVLGSFDDTPFAAASIAQVHRATLKDGTAVVIKVQRPGAASRWWSIPTSCCASPGLPSSASPGRAQWASTPWDAA